MQLLKKIILSSFLILPFFNVHAESPEGYVRKKLDTSISNKPNFDRYQDPWGMAGCGFATLFIKDKSKGAQIASSYLNAHFSAFTNSSAVSSGTSNCVAIKDDSHFQAKETFISVNLANLSKEAAQGHGEHIQTLADVFACPQDKFIQLSRTHYKEIFAVNEANSVLKNYRNQINSDKVLSEQCTNII